MFKKFLIVVALALPMFASAQTVKLGLVNTSEILSQMKETAEAQNKINEVSKKLDNEYQLLLEEMNRKAEEFKNTADNELPAIKERKSRELSEYQQKIQTFERNAMNDLQKLQSDLMAPIMKKLTDAIQAVGMENGFTIVQDLNPQSILYYSSPAVDITSDVKKKLGVTATAATSTK